DIGYGTVTLKRSDILRIARSAASGGGEIDRRKFESGRRVPDDAKRLNELYQDAQARREKARDGGQQERDGQSRELQAYFDAFRRLSDYLEGDEGKELGRGARGWQADYYAWIRRELKAMAGDFQHDVVSSGDEARGHVIVQAVLNGRVPARLLVDTGAS